jgi:hypothetical protein
MDSNSSELYTLPRSEQERLEKILLKWKPVQLSMIDALGTLVFGCPICKYVFKKKYFMYKRKQKLIK